jgi:hypothetical protein
MVTTVGRTRLAVRRCRKEDSYDIAGPGHRRDVNLRTQVALRWLLRLASNVLLIPRTGYVAPCGRTWPPKE